MFKVEFILFNSWCRLTLVVTRTVRIRNMNVKSVGVVEDRNKDILNSKRQPEVTGNMSHNKQYFYVFTVLKTH